MIFCTQLYWHWHIIFPCIMFESVPSVMFYWVGICCIVNMLFSFLLCKTHYNSTVCCIIWLSFAFRISMMVIWHWTLSHCSLTFIEWLAYFKSWNIAILNKHLHYTMKIRKRETYLYVNSLSKACKFGNKNLKEVWIRFVSLLTCWCFNKMPVKFPFTVNLNLPTSYMFLKYQNIVNVENTIRKNSKFTNLRLVI